MNRNTDFIPFARPSFTAEEEKAVIEVLRSGWLTTGAKAAEFEKQVSAKAAVKHALAVNSATSGLHLALEASGVGPGDYVITSPYTFTSTGEVIRYTGAHPLFADIESDGYNISAAEVRKILKTQNGRKGKVKAIIPIHIGGRTCDREALLDIAAEHGLAVIEDGAHLQPSPLLSDDRSILVYSFYANKCITTGEGGMVITNNDDAARRMRLMRFHGIDREAWNRYREKSGSSWSYDVVAPGYKYNLPDILAVLGLVQLGKADDFLKRRQDIASEYDKAFSECGFLKIPPGGFDNSRHLYILRIIPEELSITRDDYIKTLSEKGIGISIHYRPLHMMSYYSRTYKLKPDDFPESLSRYENSFSIPIYPDLTDEEISRIISIVLETGSRFRRN